LKRIVSKFCKPELCSTPTLFSNLKKSDGIKGLEPRLKWFS
jgi:hypothetical protein